MVTQLNQRRCFADEIYKQMMINNRIVIITGDLGFKMWDKIRKKFPKRFINVGSAEQTLLGLAVGLALEEKIPLCYSITPFLLYRPFETIRNYIDREKIPVKLIGSGRDKDYGTDGFSHWSEEDKKVMKVFKNIKSFWPESNNEIMQLVPKMLQDNSPWYINLKKT